MDKAKRFFITFISIVFFAMVLVGVYMAIQYSTSKSAMPLIFLGVAIAGILGLVIEIIIYVQIRKRNKEKDQ